MGQTIEIRLPTVGDTFEGRYRITSVLGQGGFATVFLAHDEVMSRDVALKVLSPSEGEYSAQIAKRFLREAQVFAGLEDPHTITMYDFGESPDGLLYMVFEYVRGEDLTAFVRRGALEPRVVAHIMTQVLSALREAHGRGIYHRDIKPANVLVFEYGGDPYRVKLIDFGIAKDANPHAASLTRTGRIIGTPRYMAPEQLFGQAVGADSDLYSLGLVAFELLAGRPAIMGDSNKDVVLEQVSPDPIVIPAGLAPEPLRQVLARLLSKEREDRYSSADAVLREIRSTRSSSANAAPVLPTPSTDMPPHTPTPRAPSTERTAPEAPAEGNRGRVRIAWAFGLLAIAGASYLLVSSRRSGAPAPTEVVPTSRSVAGLVAADPAEPPETLDASHAGASTDAATPDLMLDAGGGGCAADPEWRGRRWMSERFGGRGWFAYLPRDYEPGKPHPVVLMFHRSWVGGKEMLKETQMEELADEHGLVLLAFDSKDSLPWEAPGDPEYALRVIERSFDELCLDRSRVYGLGEGAGGAFIERLACVYPLSGIAMTGYAEDHNDEICMPETPTPRLRVYGTHDVHVPPDGSDSCIPIWSQGAPYRSAREIDEIWQERYGCGDKQRRWEKFRGGECRTWKCDVAPLVTCAANGGHYWPTGKPPSVDFFPSCKDAPKPKGPGFEYRDAIWRFFEKEGRLVSADLD